jgi:hypothetical protein
MYGYDGIRNIGTKWRYAIIFTPPPPPPQVHRQWRGPHSWPKCHAKDKSLSLLGSEPWSPNQQPSPYTDLANLLPRMVNNNINFSINPVTSLLDFLWLTYTSSVLLFCFIIFFIDFSTAYHTASSEKTVSWNWK